MWEKTTCYNMSLSSLKRNFFYNGFVLVQSFTNTQAPTYRELQPSLVFQLFLEGSYNPLSYCTRWDTSMQATTCKRLQPSLCFQGPRFINFQTGSTNINQTSAINQLPCTNIESPNNFSKHQNSVPIIRHQPRTQQYRKSS